MSSAQRDTPTTTPSSEGFEAAITLAVFVVLGPAGVVLGWLLGRARTTRARFALAGAALLGTGGLYLVRLRIETGLIATGRAIRRQLIVDHPHRLLVVGFSHIWKLWLIGLLGAPALGLIVSLRSPSFDQNYDEENASGRAQERRRERRLARRARTLTKTPTDRRGLFLGYQLGGDRVLPQRGSKIFLPWKLARLPMLVIGATGSGKTETLLRLCYSTALATETTIVYLDGKGDRQNKQRFESLMRNAGRAVCSFPDEAFDGWQGDAAEQTNRLLELIDYAQEGAGTYYRDLAVKLVRLACHAPTAPPSSSTEFLRRLDGKALAAAYLMRPGEQPDERRLNELDSLQAQQVGEARSRYEAFFGAAEGALDGRLHFEQLDSGYFLLDGLRLKHEAGYLARFLVEEFTQWAVARKPRERRVLLVVDEFSAIAEAASALVDVVERTRGFNVTTILAPQVAQGMGGQEAAARILGSTATILLHASPMPEEIVRIGGSRRAYSTSHQLEDGAATGLGSARLQHEYRVNPNDVRRLEVGQCYAISSGRATKLQIAPAPAT
jgi:hypothetical protein